MSEFNYRKEVMRTAAGHVDPLSLGAMGLAGEAGEVVDLIKKHVHHKVPFDRDKFIKELGDVRWYLELLCDCAGVTIQEVEKLNIEKLRKRYPDGFTTQASIERKDETNVG